MSVVKEITELEELKQRLAEIQDIADAQKLLSWDRNTYMPEGAASARAQQLATLGTIAHVKGTDPRVEELLASLKDQFEDGSDNSALIRIAKKNFERANKIPTEFIEEMTKARSACQQIWIKARQDNDFASFVSPLKNVLELTKRHADYLGYETHPYDALHDLYEEGSKVEMVNKVFAELRDATVPLVKDISSQSQLSDVPLHQHFDERTQEQLGLEVAKNFGYDFRHGRLDRTVHPFATSFSKYDVRITTRYQENFLSSSLFGTMHEAGHAMYEQGFDSAFDRSPLAGASSLGIHESQSRLWENLVGRSLEFWQCAYPRAQELFPKQLGEVSLEDFYAAINKVEPSLIRVEADEVTYNLHVMVRFELELALLEGSLNVEDLPEAWREKYQDYLSVTPPDDASGCLQDVHWSFGAIGYFPTYTLGNIMSVQLFEAAKLEHPEIPSDIQRGKFDTLLSWMRENVHRHGAKYEPMDLLKNATGSELDAKPYISYLNDKFRRLYGLEG